MSRRGVYSNKDPRNFYVRSLFLVTKDSVLRGNSDILKYISYFFNEVWIPNFSCPIKNNNVSIKTNFKRNRLHLYDKYTYTVLYDCFECDKNHVFPARNKWAYCPCDGNGKCYWCSGPHGLTDDPHYWKYDGFWKELYCRRCGGHGARFESIYYTNDYNDFFCEWNEDRKSYIFYVIDREKYKKAVRVCTCKPVDCLFDDPIEDDYMLDRWFVGGRPEEVKLLYADGIYDDKPIVYPSDEEDLDQEFDY